MIVKNKLIDISLGIGESDNEKITTDKCHLGSPMYHCHIWVFSSVSELLLEARFGLFSAG